MLIIEVSYDLITMGHGPSRGNKETKTEKTREFRPLFRTTWWPMRKKEKHMSLTLKSIAYRTLLLFPISLKQLMRSLSWIVS